MSSHGNASSGAILVTRRWQSRMWLRWLDRKTCRSTMQASSPLVGVAGVMFRYKLSSWLALIFCAQSLANMRNLETDIKQVMMAMIFLYSYSSLQSAFYTYKLLVEYISGDQ